MDWTPGYREFAPPARFRRELHCLWVSIRLPGDPPAAAVLPDGCTDLIWESGLGAYVAGPDTRPNSLVPSAGTVIVGARFRPGAGGPALGVPLSELLDQRIDAADLPALPVRLLPGSLEPDEAWRRVARIAAELVTERPPDPLVLEATRRLGRPGERAEQLAASLGISERQLRRRCQAAVGYGPRMISRVLRFRRFVSRIDAADTSVDLAGLAAEVGYADQAHLTRESARLGGLTPAALARSRRG